MRILVIYQMVGVNVVSCWRVCKWADAAVVAVGLSCAYAAFFGRKPLFWLFSLVFLCWLFLVLLIIISLGGRNRVMLFSCYWGEPQLFFNLIAIMCFRLKLYLSLLLLVIGGTDTLLFYIRVRVPLVVSNLILFCL